MDLSTLKFKLEFSSQLFQRQTSDVVALIFYVLRRISNSTCYFSTPRRFMKPQLKPSIGWAHKDLNLQGEFQVENKVLATGSYTAFLVEMFKLDLHSQQRVPAGCLSLSLQEGRLKVIVF